MNSQSNLFSAFQLGRYTLPNRLVMAPLTRNRAGVGNVPVPLNAQYYGQRASAGLIITEATQISPQGVGYPGTPGIHSAEQTEGWKLVTKAVHQQGGRIFLQLWHVGRISHPLLQPNGALPVAPSAIAPEGTASTLEGEKPFVTPRALETEEISGIVEDYRQGAENALAAGFDGVEIHSANGYLLDQFLQDGTNKRTDLGVRLSPAVTFHSISDSNSVATFSYVANALNQFNLAYLHIVEPRSNADALNNWAKIDQAEIPLAELSAGFFRNYFKGAIISAGSHNRDSGNQAIASGNADLIAYGRLFISNPDLPKRFEINSSLNPYDRSSFYGGNEKGYTDYPTLE
jgi:N-ethylmaleimide reductase